MSNLTQTAIASASSDKLFTLLRKELEERVPARRGSPAFLAQIRNLPVGLRAMAATYELDVSLTMDDLGWHFGNWHNPELAEETARGLEELGAVELASIFREAFRLAVRHWNELGSRKWAQWYHGSPLEKAVTPLNEKARAILEGKKNGIFEYWVDYARKYPERVGTASA